MALAAPSRSPRRIATTTRSCSACDLASRPRLRNWARRNGCTRAARRERHLGEIGVVRAGIDGAVERFVDLVIALRIAALDQRAQLLVRRLRAARRSAGGHALGREARAQRLELRHRLEHADQTLLVRARHHRAAMRRAPRPGRWPPAGGSPRAPACARPGTGAPARSRRAPRRARARRARSRRRAAGAAPRPASGGRCRRRGAHRDPSVSHGGHDARPGRLVDQADMRGDHAPAVGEAHPGLHLPADLAGRRVAVEQRRGDREVAAVGGDHGLATSCAPGRPASARRGTPRSRRSRRGFSPPP